MAGAWKPELIQHRSFLVSWWKHIIYVGYTSVASLNATRCQQYINIDYRSGYSCHAGDRLLHDNRVLTVHTARGQQMRHTCWHVHDVRTNVNYHNHVLSQSPIAVPKSVNHTCYYTAWQHIITFWRHSSQLMFFCPKKIIILNFVMRTMKMKSKM